MAMVLVCFFKKKSAKRQNELEEQLTTTQSQHRLSSVRHAQDVRAMTRVLVTAGALDQPWWECDIGQATPNWVQYSADINTLLMKAHTTVGARSNEDDGKRKRKQKKISLIAIPELCVRFTRGTQQYIVDFNEPAAPDGTRRQRNSHTKIERPIRLGKRECCLELPNAVPAYWQIAGIARTTSARQFELHEAPERQSDLLQKMESSIRIDTKHGMTNLQIHRVQRIENTSLWGDYIHQRENLVARRHSGVEVLADRASVEKWLVLTAIPGEEFPRVIDAQANELWLWHGTRPETAQTLAEWGFDERVANLQGLYGAGSYFADSASKSHQYSRRHKDAQGHHCMLYCRVAMGSPFLTNTEHKNARRAPENPATPGLPHDSIFGGEGVGRGGQQVHNEYVVFRSNQVYPEFIIWYSV
jgi:hypothetical protein